MPNNGKGAFEPARTNGRIVEGLTTIRTPGLIDVAGAQQSREPTALRALTDGADHPTLPLLMHPLAQLLQRARRLSQDQCEAIQYLVEKGQRRWSEAIVELNYLEAGELASLLQNKLLLPRVDEKVLAAVSAATTSAIPAATAYRFGIVPVSADGRGNLTLAMTDPTDEAAVDTASRSSGCYVMRAVVAEDLLPQMLLKHYGPGPERPEVTPPGKKGNTFPMPEQPQPVAENEDWPEAEYPFETNPTAPRSPLDAISLAAAVNGLNNVSDREHLTQQMLDFLATGLERVLLFVNTRGELRGHDGRGVDLSLELTKQVRIPAELPSRLAGVLARRKPFLGPLGESTDVDRRLSKALGEPTGPFLIFPILLGERVPF